MFMLNFRYFVDDKVRDSADRRFKHVVQLPPIGRTAAAALCEEALHQLAKVLLGPHVRKSCIPIDGDIYRAMEALREHPSITLYMSADVPSA